MPGFCVVEMPRLAFHLMELQSSVHPLPKIVVPHRNHATKSFPSPVAGPPLCQPRFQPATDVPTLGYQCHAGGTVECFQTPDDGQQFKSLTALTHFGVGCTETLTCFDVL